MAGFKFKRFSVTAGDSDFPTGDTDALRRTRSETVVSKCAQALIDCHVGWILDITKSATISSYVDIPTRTGSLNYPGLFLVNTISGCKLFMAYFNGSVQDYGIKDFSGNDVYSFHGSNYKFVGGLCMSMIPEGSTSTFGDPTTTTFIPLDATRIAGTAWYYSSGCYPTAYNPTSGDICYWGIYATPYCIATTSTHRSSGETWTLACPIYAIGRIFGTLAHEEDNSVNSKYGFVYFRSETYGYPEGFYPTIKYNINSVFDISQSGSLYIPGCSIGADTYVGGCISASDGTWLNGTDWLTHNVSFYVEGLEQIAYGVFNRSGMDTRWVPIAMMTVTRSTSAPFDVFNGDGFKGYLDVDLFRCAKGTYTQLFDNGNFICVEDNLNLLFGWDLTNDTLTF